ncbi:hypothetical protein ACEWY4_004342 [Coilia grayii]|uniref:Alpha-1A adrenergic receptor n=1 Tax=Coilia grayii TaxID=363190 RepID=A0ABD1KMB9_9TELE
MVPAEWNASTSSATELCPNCSLASLGTVPVGKAVALGLVLLVFIVCGVGGNVLVILSVAFHRHLRSVTHLFIVNLAVADLLLSAAVLPFSLAAELQGRWVFGRLLCSAWTAVDVLCCTASILSLCAISVDRYLAVSRPLGYPALATARRGACVLALLWTLAAAISVGPLLGWREPMPDDEGVCRVNEDPSYALFSALCSFYVPLAVILVMYCRVYVVARKHSRAHSRGQPLALKQEQVTLRIHKGNAPPAPRRHQENGDGGGKQKQVRQDEGSSGKGGRSRGRCSLLRLLRFSREQKAAKTLGVVVGGFVLCWLPFFLVLPIGAMFPAYHPSETVFKVTFWLGYFNSCLNPIIYPCFSQEFKRAFLSVLRAPCLCHTHPSPQSPLQLSSRRFTQPPPTPPPVSEQTQLDAPGPHNNSCVCAGTSLCPRCGGCEDPLGGCCFGVGGCHPANTSHSNCDPDSAPPTLRSADRKTVQLTLAGSQGTAV